MKGLNLIPKTENWLGFLGLCTGKLLFGSSEMRRGWRLSVHGILRVPWGLEGLLSSQDLIWPTMEGYIEEREFVDRKSGRKFTLMQILPTISIDSFLLLLVLLIQLLRFSHLP